MIRPVSPGCELENFPIASEIYLSYCDLCFIGIRCFLGLDLSQFKVCSQTYTIEDGEKVAFTEHSAYKNEEENKTGFITIVTLFDSDRKESKLTFISINTTTNYDNRAVLLSKIIHLITSAAAPQSPRLTIVTSLKTGHRASTVHVNTYHQQQLQQQDQSSLHDSDDEDIVIIESHNSTGNSTTNSTALTNNIDNNSSLINNKENRDRQKVLLNSLRDVPCLDDSFVITDPVLNILLNIVYTKKIWTTLVTISVPSLSGCDDSIVGECLCSLVGILENILPQEFNSLLSVAKALKVTIKDQDKSKLDTSSLYV